MIKNFTAGDRSPYTYLIVYQVTGQVYYGVRHAKGCHPNEIGKTYLSSSKRVKKLIALHGAQAFKFEVRRIFDSVEKARRWETRILRRFDARTNLKFFNKHNNENYDKINNTGKNNPMYGTISPTRGTKLSAETKAKISLAVTGENNGFYGQKHKPETIAKIKTKHTDEAHEKFTGYFHTPAGVFASARKASESFQVDHNCIIRWCKNPERICSKATTRSKFYKLEYEGKTFRELGFTFQRRERQERHHPKR